MELSNDMLQVALARAITESVSAEAQKEIFCKAMQEHLFRADHRAGQSPISTAFEGALGHATRQLAENVLREPENAKRIREALQAALVAALEDKRLQEKIVSKMIGGLGW